MAVVGHIRNGILVSCLVFFLYALYVKHNFLCCTIYTQQKYIKYVCIIVAYCAMCFLSGFLFRFT